MSIAQEVKGDIGGELAVIASPEHTTLLAHAPAQVLAEARQAAAAVKDVISQKARPVVMNGEQYLEYEDWQTVGRFYGITAKVEGCELVDLGGVQGFKATAVALKDAAEISRAEAYCLNDEEKWSSRTKYEWVYLCRDGSVSVEDPGPDSIVWEDNQNKPGKKRPRKERRAVGEERVPLFQLASMAQTRACSKVLRNVLAWVVVLAGYRPTPAEEIADLPGASTAKVRDAELVDRAPAREAGEDWPNRGEAAYTDNGVEPPKPAERKPAAAGNGPACPHCGNPAKPSKFPKPGATHYCYGCKHGFAPAAS